MVICGYTIYFVCILYAYIRMQVHINWPGLVIKPYLLEWCINLGSHSLFKIASFVCMTLVAGEAALASLLQHNYHKSNLHLSCNLVLILVLPG